MNEIKLFTNEYFGNLYVIDSNDMFWFLGSQVSSMLGYVKADKAISDHVKSHNKKFLSYKELTDLFQTPQNRGFKLPHRGAYLINESGLYSLIMSSRLDKVEQFKDWVVDEVLPSIRRTGSYSINNKVELPDFTNPAEAARAWANEYEAKLLAESKVKELQPKADFYDDVAGSKDAIEMGKVAKVLDLKKIGRNKLFLFLRNKKILRSNNEPYQTYIDKGYFRVIEQKYSKPDGSICINLKTLVYQSGVEFIRKLLNDELKDNDSDQIELF